MFRPTIQYKIPDTTQRDQFRTLKVRGYRYLSRFPEEDLENASGKSLSTIHSSIKSVKIAYSCRVPETQSAASLLSKLSKTLRKLQNSWRMLYGRASRCQYNKSSCLLLSRCKELTILDSKIALGDFAKGKLWVSFRALPKLEAVKIYPTPEDFECLSVLLKRTRIKVLDLINGELDALPINLLVELKLNVEEVNLRLLSNQLFDLQHHKEWLSKIGMLNLHLKPLPDQDKFEQFEQVMKNLTGLKELTFFPPSASPQFFEKALCPVVKDLKNLQQLYYMGHLAGPELQHFDSSTFSQKLITLDLDIKNQGISSETFRQFASQLRSFTHLQRFRFNHADISFANEFVSDLPHSLPALKSVEFKFRPSRRISPFPLELKLHLNSFLDWIISLPNLEEVTLAHPAFNYCYCNYLENCKVLPKLKQVSLREIYHIFDITLCEVEYLDIDLAAFLKVVLPETIEYADFSLHMELFKPKVLDMLEERLLKCSKLTELIIFLNINILNEKHLLKLEKIFASLSHVRKKKLIIGYYEVTNGLASAVLNGNHVLKGLFYTTMSFVTDIK